MTTRHVIVLVLTAFVAIGASLSIVGQDSAQDEFDAIVAGLASSLDRALYLAITGFSAYDVDDQRVAAQGLINLLEGPDGENYDESIDVLTELGILAAMEYLGSVNWPGSSLDEIGSGIYVVRDAIFHGWSFLYLAHEAALEARDPFYDSPMGSHNSFRIAYACLAAARGGLDDPFLVAGIHQLAALFPNGVPLSEEDLIQQDDILESILARCSPGDEIHLGSGVHRERVLITKSVTIEGASPEETILEGVAWDAVLMIMATSDEPVHVVLRNLTVKGGQAGVLATEFVTLTLDNVMFTKNRSALVVGKGARVDCKDSQFVANETALFASFEGEPSQVVLTECLFDGNGHAVSASGDVSVVLESCSILNGTSPYGDIDLGRAAMLDMRNSELRRIAGQGIVLADTSSMILINNVIETAYDYAIARQSSRSGPDGEVIQDCGGFRSTANEDLPLGTVLGYGNMVSGGVCPVSLLFLTEPPAELSVEQGQSIQAAIDAVADGGVVTIGEGTYRENLYIDKPLILLGVGEATIIPDDQETPAIWIAGGTEGGVIQGIRFESAATGIDMVQASWRVVDCSFHDTDVGVKAMTMDFDVLRIQQCAFIGDQAGTGVLVGGSGTIDIVNCDFHELGTGTVLGGMTSTLVDDCTFQDCYDGIVLSSGVEGTLTGNHIDGSGGSGIRVAAVPDFPNVPLLDALLKDVTLTLIDNVIENSMRRGLSLCDTNDPEVLTFTGTLLGSGNLIDNMNLLCPGDYDWPEGFFADE